MTSWINNGCTTTCDTFVWCRSNVGSWFLACIFTLFVDVVDDNDDIIKEEKEKKCKQIKNVSFSSTIAQSNSISTQQKNKICCVL